MLPVSIPFISTCIPKRDLSQNILIVQLPAEPPGLHPTNDNNAYQKLIFQSTQRRLIKYNPDSGKYIPDLLVFYPILINDSLSYSCVLRNDVTWDDGSFISYADLLFTLKMIICPLTKNPDQKSFFSQLKSIKQDAENPRQFTLELKERFFNGEGMFSSLYLLQKKVWDPSGVMDKFSIEQFTDPTFNANDYAELVSFTDQFNHPDNARVPSRLQGLGPYRVSEWETGSYIKLIKKKENKACKNCEIVGPEIIIFRVIQHMESLVLSLKKQEIDVSLDLSSAGLVKLQKRAYFHKNYHSGLIGSSIYTYFGMNMKPGENRMPYFTDLNTRKALAMLAPLNEILEVSTKGTGKRMTSFVLPESPAYNDKIPLIDYNLREAVGLLEKAGWIDQNHDGIREKLIGNKRVKFSFSLMYMMTPPAKEIAGMIRRSFSKAGIEVLPEPLDFAVFYESASMHQFDAMLGSWSSPIGEEDPRQLWHTENWKNNGSNFVGFGNAKTDALIDAMNKEMSKEKRLILLKDFQRIVADNYPYVFLFNATKKTAVHKRFQKTKLFPESPNIILNQLLIQPNPKESSPTIF